MFDFLYHDARRVAALSSQLDERGTRTSVKSASSGVTGGKRGASINVGASVPILGVANVGGQLGAKEGERTSSDVTYDPIWANAISIISALREGGRLVSDLADASFGNLIHLTGALSMIDLTLMQKAWSLDGVRRTVLAGGTAEQVEGKSRNERRADRKTSPLNAKGPPTNEELVIELLKICPHALTASLNGSFGSLWAVLDESYLIGDASDVVLKHGHRVPGEWTILGILDARPDVEFLGTLAGVQDPVEDILNGDGALLFNSLIGNVTRQLAPLIRGMLGRPANAFGVTPVLIYRAVG